MPDNQEINEDFTVSLATKPDEDAPVVITGEARSEHWMNEVLEHWTPKNLQWSAQLKDSDTQTDITLEKISQLAKNAQSDLEKIISINEIVRQMINYNDILGTVYESLLSNLNSNYKLSYDNLPEKYKKKTLDQAKSLINKFNKEINIESMLLADIPTVYTEGNCIKYLREKNGHYICDTYPLGVAVISDYSVNGLPCVLIDINELKSRLQKTMIKGNNRKALFFETIQREIQENYPEEVYRAFKNKEQYALLNIKRTGVNRFANMNRKYGLTPVFKALPPTIMLNNFDKADAANAKARTKKIIFQKMRKEMLGPDYNKKALEEMVYSHTNLINAWGAGQNVVVTTPPFVEDLKYVESKGEITDTKTVNQYRSRVTNALGIAFRNTDGDASAISANMSLKQLMRTIDKIAQQEAMIIQNWYQFIFEENDIPLEYCPTIKIVDTELLEMDMKRDLCDLLFSKLGASYQTAYGILGYDVNDEIQKRKDEKDRGVEDIFIPHATAYNSNGNEDTVEDEGGRPPAEGDDVNLDRQVVDKTYNEEVRQEKVVN